MRYYDIGAHIARDDVRHAQETIARIFHRPDVLAYFPESFRYRPEIKCHMLPIGRFVIIYKVDLNPVIVPAPGWFGKRHTRRVGRFEQDQALQTHRLTLREDKAQLRIHRRSRSRIHFTQIRLQRLGFVRE